MASKLLELLQLGASPLLMPVLLRQVLQVSRPLEGVFPAKLSWLRKKKSRKGKCRG